MKRFYNNKLMRFAPKGALRFVALLCVLLGMSSSAWGAYYLHYNNTGSHTKDIGASDLKWTDEVEPVNNVCTWTITTSAWDNYVYIMSSKANKTVLDITGATISNKSSNIDFGNISDHNSKKLFYFKQKSAKQITITITYNLSTKVITFADGSADTCTPSATITGAKYENGKITLSGSLTKTCGEKTYYGWQYNNDGKTWGNDYVAGAPNDTHHSTTAVAFYTQDWTGFEKGKTYYFRAYAYQNGVFYSDGTIKSVKVPEEGGSAGGEVNCNGIVYLDPNEIWNSDNAWYAAYYWNDGQDGKWLKMEPTNCGNDIHYCKIPDGYTKIIFVRMDPSKLALSWDSKWNQTNDLTIEYKRYQITNIGIDGAKSSGQWIDAECKYGCEAADVATNVLLSRNAVVNKSTKKATLYGYLKATNCNIYTDYGFKYCKVNDGDSPCKPNKDDEYISVDPADPLLRGTEFSATLSDIEDGKTYYYRAYATSDKGTILSEEIRSFSTDPCIPQVGGKSNKYVAGTPIVYTINAAPEFVANDCKLYFKSLQDAIDHLKNTNTRQDDYKYVELTNGSYNLLQPVEMRVVYYDDQPDDDTKAYMYEGTDEPVMSAGQITPKYANLIQDVNKTAANNENTLTIKAGTSKAKPWIHHIVVRNSRNIVLDSLCIFSDKDGGEDNAMEFDLNTSHWHAIDGPYATVDNRNAYTPVLQDANILVQNCVIGSKGFAGVHFSGYSDITFKNNDFEAVYEANTAADNYSNIINYGSSAKFISCNNIKFIQNNFRGSHPTLLWLQECYNVLIMNNVFWNTNTIQNTKDDQERTAAIRLIHQFKNQGKPNVSNVSIFYNTFYLAEYSETASGTKYDFLRFSNTVNNNEGSSSANFDINTIKFQYNNCYSYDANVDGKNESPFLGLDLSNSDKIKNFCPNNFWSANASADFSFGCSDNKNQDVSKLVCETSASGPSTLIVKGTALNLGAKPDYSSTGIELDAKEQNADRYLTNVRPVGSGWTYGAYQSKGEIPTGLIYWVGKTDKWDDRGNWEYETYDEAEGKMVRQRVSCVNTLSDTLRVVIEEVGTVEIEGGRKWPVVPASFDANDRKTVSGIPTGEQVSAGDKKKFASTIELEYGAGLKGVENLKDSEGNMLYDKAIVHFDADRSKWLLVGNVVKPFKNGKDGSVRSVKSGDYYINHLPQVYMNQAELSEDGSTISWGKTFATLEDSVYSNEVYAINVTGYYGTSWYPAAVYNRRYGTNYSATEAHPYRFTGRFAVSEENEPGENFVYELKPGKNLLNNLYPCNLNVTQLEQLGMGTVALYDYNLGCFESTEGRQARALPVVRSQNGFVFIPDEGVTELELSQALLAEGSTRTRSEAIEQPTFSLDVDNANTSAPGTSNVVIKYDELLGSGVSALNTPKVFTLNENTPEVYVINNDAQYTRFITGKEKVSIPLGVRLQKPMNLTFKKVYNEGYDEVILVDTKTQKYYNLLERTYTTGVIGTGDTDGRFYINLTASNDVIVDDEEDDDVNDDNITTDTEDVTETAEINIYAVNDNTIRVVTAGTSLQSIHVSDMAGHTGSYVVEGNVAEIQMPVSQGVYLVHVVCDNLTRSEKVILK